MKVKDMMHRGVSSVTPDISIAAVARHMKERDVGAMPVLENDQLIGMITDRDIALRALADGKDISSLTARDVMTEGVLSCREADELDEALEIMQRQQVRRLPVLNREDRLVGMLSIGDVAHAAPPKNIGEMMKAVSAHHG